MSALTDPLCANCWRNSSRAVRAPALQLPAWPSTASHGITQAGSAVEAELLLPSFLICSANLM